MQFCVAGVQMHFFDPFSRFSFLSFLLLTHWHPKMEAPIPIKMTVTSQLYFPVSSHHYHSSCQVLEHSATVNTLSTFSLQNPTSLSKITTHTMAEQVSAHKIHRFSATSTLLFPSSARPLFLFL